MGMMSAEKIVKGLECCIRPGNCITCPWYPTDDAEEGCIRTLMRNTYTLLKAQEPKVISLRDAEDMTLCWIETRFPHTISPADLIHYFDESPNITIFKLHQTIIDWPIDEYGVKWQCWDKEPTNAQMEVTPWHF